MQRDEFFWTSTINKATIVVNAAEGLLSKEAAREAAGGVARLEAKAEKDPALRVKSYIAYEPLLIAETSPAVTLIHAGRSSQDILSTQRTAILRDRTVQVAKAFDAVIGKLLDLAEANRHTIVPNYTNGVAAQPNSYAHYLLGITAAFLRDRERLNECLTRYNACAMGSTVLNGTGWPLNREAMAVRLGFPAPRRNAFDATCMSPADMPFELASINASAALHVGSFISDVMVQYAQPRPWILLQEGGENTYVSSAMPQKRNPGLMNNCRADASDVVGEMAAAAARIHNLVPGMVDGKNVAKNGRMMDAAVGMFSRFLKVLCALRINPDRALEELNSDWTASQEVADVLMREYKLPFRVGHHVASHIVTYARNNNLSPTNFPYEQVKKIYAEVIKSEYPQGNPVCPMSEQELRDTLNPTAIVANRKTEGGPQPAELTKALSAADAAIAEQREWTKQNRRHIDQSLAKLDADFQKLVEQK